MSQEDEITELKAGLDPLLKCLDGDIEPTGLKLETGSIDSEVLSYVYFASSKLSQWILADFAHSEQLERELWVIFSSICARYRHIVEQYSIKGEPDRQEKYKKDYDRMNKVMKVMGQFYKEYIKRVIELEGATMEIRRLIPLLRIEIPETQIKEPAASIANRVKDSVKNSLCKLGDLSRYRTTLNYHAAEQTAKNSEQHKHAFVYYNSAVSITPDDGTPPNQLANLCIAMKDYFSTFYWFLKSQTVEAPFGVDNVSRIARKIASMDQKSIMESSMVLEGEPKFIILNLLLLYASSFNMQILQQKRTVGELDSDIEATCHKFNQLLTDQRIPRRILIQVSLMGPMITYIAEQKVQFRRGDQSIQVYNITMKVFGTVVKAALASLAEYHETNTPPMHLQQLLPVLRIYFDWFAKFLSHDIQDWESVGRHHCESLFQDIVQLVETLRRKYGFKFDPQTAVKTLSGKGELQALEEEKVCMGVSPFHGGLNDTPSGIHATGLIKEDVAQFQCQCLMFSAVEIGRLGFTSLRFDEQELVFGLSGGGDRDVEDDEDQVLLKPRRFRPKRG